MATDTELAWLAGIWDGEGSIFFQTQAKRQLTPYISMDNTDPHIIAEAFRILKDLGIVLHINETAGKKDSTRTVYRIATARHEYIKVFIENVGPFLKGEKKSKANLMLPFILSRLERGKQQYNQEERSIVEEFRSSTTTREESLAAMI